MGVSEALYLTSPLLLCFMSFFQHRVAAGRMRRTICSWNCLQPAHSRLPLQGCGGKGEEDELSVQPVFYEDSASKIQTVGEALALELHLWLQFSFYGSLSCL